MSQAVSAVHIIFFYISFLAQLINALHIFAFLEAIHTYVGLTSGKTLTSITQCAGRAIICLYLSQYSRAQTSEFVFGLWMAWSLSEIIRYPYYMSAVSN